MKKKVTNLEFFAACILQGQERALEALYQSNICPYETCPFGYAENERCEGDDAKKCWQLTEDDSEDVSLIN